MRISLTFPTRTLWTLKEGPNDQLAAILGGSGTGPDLVVTYGPLIVRPDEPQPWMDQVVHSDLPRGSRVTLGRTGAVVTTAGWPLRLVEAEVVDASGALIETRLCAFFTFMEHASVVVVRAADRARLQAHNDAVLEILATGRPDWRGAPTCLADVWDLGRPRPSEDPPRPQRAKQLRTDPELETALAQIVATLTTNPTALDHLRHGRVLLEVSRPADALEAVRAALVLDPTLERAYYLSGLALGELGKHAEAIAAWEQALALSPDRVDTVYNLAQARFLVRDYERALVGFQAVVRLEPDDVMTTRKIIQCLYALERYNEGLAARAGFREQWATTQDPSARLVTEYVFAQFEADGFRVHALETLRPGNPAVHTLLTFQAFELHGKGDYALPATVTIETSDQATHAGTPFVIGLKAGRVFRVVSMVKDLPPYPTLKAEASRLLAEALARAGSRPYR
jgi:tetratricopeptide (TPR) repeat protein